MVAIYTVAVGAGVTEVSASLNRNDIKVTEVPVRIGRDGDAFSFVNDEDVFDTENHLPKSRGVFIARHSWSRFEVMGRANWYGSYKQANHSDFTDPDNIQKFGGKILIDMEATWRVNSTYRLAFGGLNVFGETPDRAEFEACCGRIYRSDSVISWQGPYYYLRASANF